MEYASPLLWPVTKPRTPNREMARFMVTPAQVKSELEDELRKMRATHAILSSNMELSRAGIPYAQQKGVTDPAVALYFTWEGEDYRIACDKWTLVWDNVRGVGKHLAAIRGIARWTGEGAVKEAFAGFAALPEGGTSGTPWWDVLGVSHDAPISVIHPAYLELARKHHPDSGGSAEQMCRLNEAFRQAQQERSLPA